MSATEPIVAAVPTRWADYVALCKPRLTLMAAFAAVVGYVAALGETALTVRAGLTMLTVMVATALAGAGASALNQVLERDADSRMARTSDRPIPSGRLDVRRASIFGIAAVIAGVTLPALFINLLSAAVVATTVVTYLFAYTPLKRTTAHAVFVGAVPGALPPVIGWTAATGSLEAGAAALFAILFIWQIPHFLSIAWMYRSEYAAAGYSVLSVEDPTGRRLWRQQIGWTLVLIPVSLLPTVLGLAGYVYYVGALLLGCAFLAYAVEVARLKTHQAARQHMFASLAYLGIVFALLMIDRVG